MKHPLMRPGGMSDLPIPEVDVSTNADIEPDVVERGQPPDCSCSSPRACYCYDNGHTGDTICLTCGEEIG